jgi:hypothetical protein
MVDVVANLADAFEREVLRVVEDPADSADAGSDWAHLLAAGRDGDVGPGERLLVELPWRACACADSVFLQRFQDLRVY